MESSHTRSVVQRIAHDLRLGSNLHEVGKGRNRAWQAERGYIRVIDPAMAERVQKTWPFVREIYARDHTLIPEPLALLETEGVSVEAWARVPHGLVSFAHAREVGETIRRWHQVATGIHMDAPHLIEGLDDWPGPLSSVERRLEILRDALRRGQLSPSLVEDLQDEYHNVQRLERQVMAQVGRVRTPGLDTLWAWGPRHGDLHAGNILGTNPVRLVDWLCLCQGPRLADLIKLLRDERWTQGLQEGYGISDTDLALLQPWIRLSAFARLSWGLAMLFEQPHLNPLQLQSELLRHQQLTRAYNKKYNA